MTIYEPDVWQVLSVFNPGPPASRTYRLLSGWVNKEDGHRYRISSVINKAEDRDNYMVIHCDSGSVYLCKKSGVGLNQATAHALKEMQASWKYKYNLLVEPIRFHEMRLPPSSRSPSSSNEIL